MCNENFHYSIIIHCKNLTAVIALTQTLILILTASVCR